MVLPKSAGSPKPCALEQHYPLSDIGSGLRLHLLTIFNVYDILQCEVAACCPHSFSMAHSVVELRGNSHLGFTSDCHRSVAFTQGDVKWGHGGGRSGSSG